MMHFSPQITTSTLAPLKYVCENHKTNLKTRETIFRKIYSLLDNYSFNSEPDPLNLRNGSDTAQKVIRIFIIRF